MPTSVNAHGSHEIDITTVEHDFQPVDNACTADLGPTTSVVRLPAHIDAAQALLVKIDASATHLTART